MVDDFVDGLLSIGFGFFFLAAICLGLVVSCDGIQSLRARNATFACERQNYRAVRKTFSTEVACTPRNLGSDTLNVKNTQ